LIEEAADKWGFLVRTLKMSEPRFESITLSRQN